jgi:hypothetical protein
VGRPFSRGAKIKTPPKKKKKKKKKKPKELPMNR